MKVTLIKWLFITDCSLIHFKFSRFLSINENLSTIRVRVDGSVYQPDMQYPIPDVITHSILEKRNAAQQDTDHFLLFPLSKTMI
ncbi:hypothetical protein EFS38_00770 [Dickeya undicola]|uniref:Uncharacterized protein n=1 Tax=Dickeya undicola TaxID=1577887 RepID=A0ABX9WYY9_9GAMM|nr:hypothetical protein EFS38_00770 [Dickeya undicola]